MPATDEEKSAIRTLELQVARINTSLRFLIGIGTLLAGAALTGLWQSYQAVRLVTRIEVGVTVLQRDFAEMKQDFAEMRRDVTGLKGDVKALDGRVAHIETDVAGLKTDIAGLKTDVAGLKTDVAGLKTDVAGLKTDVAGLKKDTAELKTDVKAQSQALDRIEKALAANRPEKRPQ